MKILLVLFILVGLSIGQNATQQDSTAKNPNQQQQSKDGQGFVDADGDGYNDNAPDHDGDGIPDGLDPDYAKFRKMRKFVDLDGDGIDDNLTSQGKKALPGLVPKGNNPAAVEQGSGVKSTQAKKKKGNR